MYLTKPVFARMAAGQVFAFSMFGYTNGTFCFPILNVIELFFSLCLLSDQPISYSTASIGFVQTFNCKATVFIRVIEKKSYFCGANVAVIKLTAIKSHRE